MGSPSLHPIYNNELYNKKVSIWSILEGTVMSHAHIISNLTSRIKLSKSNFLREAWRRRMGIYCISKRTIWMGSPSLHPKYSGCPQGVPVGTLANVFLSNVQLDSFMYSFYMWEPIQWLGERREESERERASEIERGSRCNREGEFIIRSIKGCESC